VKAKEFVASLPAYAVPSTLPIILSGMDSSEKFQTVVAACEVLIEFAQSSPLQIAAAIPELAPVVSKCMNDMKEEVRIAAKAAMTECADTIDNRDIESAIPLIIDSVHQMDKVDATIQKLAATTFVQTVDGSALGIIAPLLLRGFKEKSTALRRQSAVIVNNMSKLVEVPSEAAPFLPELLPACQKATEDVSDPEARGVCEKALAQLKSIEEACKTSQSGKKANPELALKALQKSVGDVGEFYGQALAYVASLACSLGNSKQTEQAEWQKVLTPFMSPFLKADKVAAAVQATQVAVEASIQVVEEEEADDDAEELCNCQFTLAYGTKILLHNTQMKLKRGYKYGLLGPNDCGKTTLMRSITNGQVEGFPDANEVRTVFVEADILGELSELCCLDYVFADPRIKKAGIPREEVARIMLSVGFTEKMLGDAVTTLSGGWRMKLALSRAMLQKADILLMDEPTNHLDVINVKWVIDYLKGLKNVTCLMVSTHPELLNSVCNQIVRVNNLKLDFFKGTGGPNVLDEFVAKFPESKSFFEFKATKLKFSFPQPGFIEGVKHRSTALMKMKNCDFTYPGNTVPTLTNVTCQVSLSSRVACVGRNGAGKSTMIKMLTGETTPNENDAGKAGLVWKHPNARVAYVAQHAFHHIEQHLEKTPNEYIRWRYGSGDDKEALKKDSMQLTPEEEELTKKPIAMDGGVVRVH
jgi:elongation factor 3